MRFGFVGIMTRQVSDMSAQARLGAGRYHDPKAQNAENSASRPVRSNGSETTENE